MTLFGADGKQAASYTPNISFTARTVTFTTAGVRVYFGGRLVGQYLATTGLWQAVIQDRLGSVGKYYPYGEERNASQLPNDQVKFARTRGIRRRGMIMPINATTPAHSVGS